jgi:hypothetical protein
MARWGGTAWHRLSSRETACTPGGDIHQLSDSAARSGVRGLLTRLLPVPVVGRLAALRWCKSGKSATVRHLYRAA